MTTGEIVKHARIKYRMTLREVSAKCGMSNAFLSQIETGKIKSFTTDTLKQLVVAFPMYEQEILMSQGIKGMFYVE